MRSHRVFRPLRRLRSSSTQWAQPLLPFPRCCLPQNPHTNGSRRISVHYQSCPPFGRPPCGRKWLPLHRARHVNEPITYKDPLPSRAQMHSVACCSSVVKRAAPPVMLIFAASNAAGALHTSLTGSTMTVPLYFEPLSVDLRAVPRKPNATGHGPITAAHLLARSWQVAERFAAGESRRCASPAPSRVTEQMHFINRHLLFDWQPVDYLTDTSPQSALHLNHWTNDAFLDQPLSCGFLAEHTFLFHHAVCEAT